MLNTVLTPAEREAIQPINTREQFDDELTLLFPQNRLWRPLMV